ncbi:MAG: hypothetical protein BWY74_02105 [Firmicutes bacterium ADurb.Bin419]|nr:MAG: hypothetical protein BWY74_02105 [Firmicutes bacterium ADurb.Bin419]
MKRFGKLCLVASGLVAVLSFTGCNSDRPGIDKTNQATIAPTQKATPVSSPIVEEEKEIEKLEEKEVDPAVLESLVGIWKVEKVNKTSTTEKDTMTDQLSIFGENDNASYLLFKDNGDMFYFYMDKALNNVETPFLQNEKRYYKITAKYLELNAKHIKVKYDYQLDGDNLLLKSEEGYASLVRDHEIESNQAENLQELINKYKESLIYIDIN